MEIRDINYAIAGNEIGIIDLEDGTVLRCLEVYQVRTMDLYGAAYKDGKKLYDGEFKDFRLPVTSIRVQRLEGTRVVEIREFLTSICKDDSAKKAFRAIRELKDNLYHAELMDVSLSTIEIILAEARLPYIRNAYGLAKTYFRSAFHVAKPEIEKHVPSKDISYKLYGRNPLLYSILEAAAAKEK